jgi:uncharacterized protein
MYYQVEHTNLRIAGAMDLFSSDSSHMPGWLSDAYDWAGDLVIESEPNSIVPHLRLPDGSTLRERLPERAWRELLSLLPDHDSATTLGAMRWLTTPCT